MQDADNTEDPYEDELGNEFLTQAGLIEKIHTSNRTFQRMKAKGEAPPSIRISPRIEIWSPKVVRTWLLARTRPIKLDRDHTAKVKPFRSPRKTHDTSPGAGGGPP